MSTHRWSPTRLRTVAVAAPLLAFLAACADTSVSPLTRDVPRTGATSLLSPATSGLNPTSVKYRDGAGTSHATGRSGSATLEGVAVLAADGTTRLTITTGDLDHPTRAPGQIVKAQLKAFAADGADLFVENRNGLSGGGTQTFVLRGLAADDRVQVQANVRGIDGNRTDVVTLTASVSHAPVLDVDISVPPEGTVGIPSVIVGTVTETGGDQGSHADCILYVNGQAVDQATNIWVDAGDAVTCAFTYTPPSDGSYDIEIQVVPDLAGGVVEDGATLQVSGPGQAGYTASAQYSEATTSTTFEYSWWKPDGSHKEYSETNSETHRNETIQLQATLARPVVFPLASADLSMVSGGITWESEAWTDLAGAAGDNGQVCANRQVHEQGSLFWVCNGGLNATVGYTRFAGTVVYHSEGFGHIWDGLTSTATHWTWNNSYEAYGGGGAVRALGPTVQVNLRLVDPSGSFQFNPTIPLAPYARPPGTTPRSCFTESPYWLDGGTQTVCNSGSSSETGVEGSTSG
jgi:hypothetical protein